MVARSFVSDIIKNYSTIQAGLNENFWAQIITFFLEGDSLTSQHTTSTTIFNSIGYVNALNAYSKGRTPYLITENFGLGGGTLNTINSEKTSLAAATSQCLIFMAGTNDAGVASPNLATMKSDFLSIKNYVMNTLGKRMIVVTILPRTQDAGVPLTTTQLNVIKDYNAFLKAMNNPSAGFIVIDGYNDLCITADTPNPTMFKDESGKLLHINPEGSLTLARSMWRQLRSYGFRPGNIPSTNLFTFGNMTGTSGVVSTNASGQVVNGLTLSGSGGTNTRLGIVTAYGQRVTWSPAATSGASAIEVWWFL
jgi:hypothetical protein